MKKNSMNGRTRWATLRLSEERILFVFADKVSWFLVAPGMRNIKIYHECDQAKSAEVREDYEGAEKLYKADFMVEQTDMPFLVRLDNQEFLREKDQSRGG